jgi:hypothetical protein
MRRACRERCLTENLDKYISDVDRAFEEILLEYDFDQ